MVAPGCMCVYVCVCISLFKYRRIEKVIQGQTLHILSDIYTIGTNKKEHFYWLKFEKKEVFMMKS